MAATKPGKVVVNASPHLQTPGGPANAERRQSVYYKMDENHTLNPDDHHLKRRKSGFKGVAAARRMTRVSLDKDAAAAVAASVAAKAKVRLENTYQLAPKENQGFRYGKCEALIYDLLESMLGKTTYQPDTASTLVAMVSERVKAAVRELHCERHKLVTSVLAGPVSDRGMVVASRCLWDPSSDSSATVTFNNGSLCVIVTVYAVYYE